MDTLTPSSGTLTIPTSHDTKFRVVWNQNITSVAFSPNPSGYGRLIELELEQDATGGHTIAGWPSSVRWTGGAAPTFTSTANKVDVIAFRQVGNPNSATDATGAKYRELYRALNSAA